MATFQEREDSEGRIRHRAIVRKKVGGKTVTKTKTFSSKSEAEAWSLSMESNLENMSEFDEVSLRAVISPRLSYSSVKMQRVYAALLNSPLGSISPSKIDQSDVTFYLLNRAADGASETEVQDETHALEGILSDLEGGKEESKGSKSIKAALNLAKKAGIGFNSPCPESAPRDKSDEASS
ncbi:hypothetical protein [Endozoicomonas sp. ALC066]|uniref:hypothetical protein n=1 Tax=Endozoicomonas sp. ALC066 TaxID=3403078 RepID=UPI003BB6BE81